MALVTWLDRHVFPRRQARRPRAEIKVSHVDPDEKVLRLPVRGGVLIFDGYCGFCTRAVMAVLRHDRRGRVRALPLQGPDVLHLARLTRAQAMEQAWWIGADGTRRAGAGAMAAAVTAATGAPAVQMYRLPPVRATADRVYRWVADHRRLLRGVTPYCEASPEAGCDAELSQGCGVSVST